MMTRQATTNLLALLAVALVVAGAALYRSHRAGGAAAASPSLPRLVDLGSDQCKECKQLAPILEALRAEYRERLLVEFIDVVKNPEAKAPYAIRMIPTQVLYDRDGIEVWRHEGFIAGEELKAVFAEKVGVE